MCEQPSHSTSRHKQTHKKKKKKREWVVFSGAVFCCLACVCVCVCVCVCFLLSGAVSCCSRCYFNFPVLLFVLCFSGCCCSVHSPVCFLLLIARGSKIVRSRCQKLHSLVCFASVFYAIPLFDFYSAWAGPNSSIHIYMCVCMYLCIEFYRYTHVYMCIRTCLLIHSFVSIYMKTEMRVYTCVCMYVCIYVCMYV